MENKRNWLVPIIITVVLIAILGGLIISKTTTQKATGNKIKIGFITDITGLGSYYGSSSIVGASLAEKELEKDGYDVEIIYEDFQMDTAKALSAAKKLVEVDKVDALYVELNPAVYAVTPYLKDLQNNNLLVVYGSAGDSPSKVLPYAFKTYFNYETACNQMAQKYKNQGIKKMGMLKVNAEWGELCNAGVKEVYGDNMVTEAYDIGQKDFKTQVLKLKEAKVEAIISPSFEGDQLATFKSMKDYGFEIPYGTAQDSVSIETKNAYPEMIQNITIFGFTDVDSNMLAKFTTENKGKELTNTSAAAKCYLHVMQMAKAVDGSNGDIKTIFGKMKNMPSESLLKFDGFDENRSAIFDLVFGPVK